MCPAGCISEQTNQQLFGKKVSLNPTDFNPIFKYNFWNYIMDFITRQQRNSSVSAERDSWRQSHINDRSRVASAAIITALLQGKAACKQESWDTKQVKTTQNDSEVSETWKQQVNFNGCKKPQPCSPEKWCITNKKMNMCRADCQLITSPTEQVPGQPTRGMDTILI